MQGNDKESCRIVRGLIVKVVCHIRADQACKGLVRTSEAQQTACLKVCGKKELSPFEEKKERPGS